MLYVICGYVKEWFYRSIFKGMSFYINSVCISIFFWICLGKIYKNNLIGGWEFGVLIF